MADTEKIGPQFCFQHTQGDGPECADEQGDRQHPVKRQVRVKQIRLLLPDDLSSGSYEVWVKVYDWQTGVALPVVGADSTADGQAILLTTIDIVTD